MTKKGTIGFGKVYWFVSLKMFQDGKAINREARRLWYKEIKEWFGKSIDDSRFKTKAEAEKYMAEVKKIFPDYPMEVVEGTDVFL